MANKHLTLKNVQIKDNNSRIFILFIQTAAAVLKYMDACFHKKMRLSTIKFFVLQVLASNNGKMKPSEIAAWTFRERHDITTLVDRMEKDGLVMAAKIHGDGRSVIVNLTPKGRETLEQAILVARDIITGVMASIVDNEITLLEKSLTVIRQNANNELEKIIQVPRNSSPIT